MQLIKQYEKNLKAIYRKKMLILLKDYEEAFNEVSSIQRLLLLNKAFEEELNEILPKGFKVKDLTTLNTVKEVSRIAKKMKETYPELDKGKIDSIIERIHRKTEELKMHSYLMNKQRAQNESDLIKTGEESAWNDKYKEIFEIVEGKKLKSKGIAELDQAQVDAEILKFKKGRTDLEKKLFDTLMLGGK